MNIDDLIYLLTNNMDYVPNNDNNPYSLHHASCNYFLADIDKSNHSISFTYQIVDEKENSCLRRFVLVINYASIQPIELIKKASYLLSKYSTYYMKLNQLLDEIDTIEYPYKIAST